MRTIEGQVSVLSGKQECAPRYGLDLDEGDAIRTGEKAWALLSMMDGTKITVRPDTEVRITIYRYADGGEAWQNRAVLALTRGALRVTAGRMATVAADRGSGFVVRTPGASMEIRGADSDITHIATKSASAGSAPVGTYGRAYAGEAVLKNGGGEATIRDGQTAYAELRAPPRVLNANPYFYFWHSYIDRRAAAVAERLDPAFVP